MASSFAFSPVPCHISLLRLSRLLKWHSVETFFFLSDYRTSKPNRLRAFKLILYLSVAMHWVACLYYTISEYEGLGTNDWVYTETAKGGDHFARLALNYRINNNYSAYSVWNVILISSPQMSVFSLCFFVEVFRKCTMMR